MLKIIIISIYIFVATNNTVIILYLSMKNNQNLANNITVISTSIIYIIKTSD